MHEAIRTPVITTRHGTAMMSAELVGGTQSAPAAWTALVAWLAVSAIVVISVLGRRDV